ncbi:hypothetical protein D6D23_01741 [Aureobasidium pullulans]|nr:hypothetical protein D6D23_01741 [Aureobasidium pullulans]THZ96978.1 hypothetical protein D6C82_06729 [Aureobasidium pullulans]
MSSATASILENTKPYNVTAWSYDISIQMLEDDISKLKKNPTQNNLEHIVKKETSITEKKIALEKHCRQFGITYKKFGTEESEIKLESTNGEKAETKTESANGEAGVMTKDEAKHTPVSSAKVPVPLAQVNKMETDSSVPPIDAATDAANAAALDEIMFPPVTGMLNGIYSPQPHQSGMSAQALLNSDFSFIRAVDAEVDDPFIASPGNDTSTGFFPSSPSSNINQFPSFGGFGGGGTVGRINDGHFPVENYTTAGMNMTTEEFIAQDLARQEALTASGKIAHNGVAHSDIQDFGASAGPVKEPNFKADDDDEDMTFDAPIIEHTKVVVPGMEDDGF